MKLNVITRVTLLLAVIALSFFYISFPTTSIQAANFTEVAAIRLDNTLQVTIPTTKFSEIKTGKLLVDILDAKNNLVAQQQVSVADSTNNAWKINLALPANLKEEDLIWYRLRCRFFDSDSQKAKQTTIYAINQIFHQPIIHLLGQRELIAGVSNSLRIIATDDQNGEPISGLMSIKLAKSEKILSKTTTEIDQHGTSSLSINVPAKTLGESNLELEIKTSLGTRKIVERVSIVERDSILLTVDKPIYQPGHLVYIRSLALDKFSHQAVSKRPILFEIEDAKGNKVFKKRATTDEFGVASTEFQLAEEVNMGAFKLRAILGDSENQPSTQEKSFKVERYVLPKFKVSIKMSGDSNKQTEQKFYAPGDTVTGKISAKYLFGKPIARGRVKINMVTFDVSPFPPLLPGNNLEAEAILDDTGEYNFALRLPESLVGQQFEQGAAPVSLEVEVTDRAGHTEYNAEKLLVTDKPILITAIPESGEIIPNLTNRVYLLTSYPNGKPAKTTIKLNNTKLEDLTTDKDGIAMVELKPGVAALNLLAMDEAGKIGVLATNLKQRYSNANNLILRTDKALYKVGEKVEIAAISTKQKGSVYVDVIKDKQTVLTSALELNRGKAQMSLDLSADMFGLVEIRTYLFGRDANPISDRRLIFVDPADDLQIETKMAKDSFRPGEEAQVQINVKDKQGNPKSAVLDLQVVDEAVFALSEKKPGLEKMFFYLEQELLKPRYEIHSFGNQDIFLDEGARRQPNLTRQNAAQVLFAATNELSPYNLKKSYQELDNLKQNNYYGQYYQLVKKQVLRILGGLNKYYLENKKIGSNLEVDLPKASAARFLTKRDLIDPWGQSIKFEKQNNEMYQVTINWPATGEEFYFFVKAKKKSYSVHQQNDQNNQQNSPMKLLGIDKEVVVVTSLAMEASPDGFIEGGVAGGVAGGVLGGVVAGVTGGVSTGAGTNKVRSYFPETLYVNPKLITDKNGQVTVRIPLADSITTWRMTMLASTKQGALGSATTGIKVFQDFFIDLDLPVSLTQDDSVSIPVAVYNYLNDAQDVELKLKQEDWFTLVNDNPVKQVRVGAGEVTASSYRIQAKKLGNNKLTVYARLLNHDSAANGDAISRQIEVLPNGEQQNIVVNDKLENNASKEIVIPENSVEDASKILVKLYPGALSQVVEGLDSMLRMPNGCFEQTSASTYPNVLVLDYMKATKKITPELQVKAEGFISTGYQRLVSFEVAGGGFSWFGHSPANKVLTAFGLMEFSDMSKVYEIDPRVIQRTQNWFVYQQKSDGSWPLDTYFVEDEVTRGLHDDQVRNTAYIAWALAYSGYKGNAIARAKSFIDKNLTGKEDAYTLAILSNFAIDSHQDQVWTRKMMDSLIDKATQQEKIASWIIEGKTPTYSQGSMADIETTALATQALVKSGTNTNLATKALKYLTDKKDAYGNWYSTQATVLVLKALLLSQQKYGSQVAEGIVSVNINGQKVNEIKVNKDNNDLMQQLDLKTYTHIGQNKIDLQFNGKGSMLYQIVGRYYKPWAKTDTVSNSEPLSIDIKYDRIRLAQDDVAIATVTIRNNVDRSADMVMVDLGIAPGFELLKEDLQEFIKPMNAEKLGNLTKFTVTPKQVILYFDGLRPKQTLTLTYRLRAKYPIKAKTFASKVYQYYNPEINATAKPIELIVEK